MAGGQYEGPRLSLTPIHHIAKGVFADSRVSDDLAYTNTRVSYERPPYFGTEMRPFVYARLINKEESREETPEVSECGHDVVAIWIASMTTTM